MWRARNTVLPYLKEVNAKGEKLWMVEAQPNGQFKLEIYNDAPYGKNGASPR